METGNSNVRLIGLLFTQVCGQPPTSAVNVTLLAFAAVRRAAVPLLLGARRCRSMFPVCTALSSKPAARRS